MMFNLRRTLILCFMVVSILTCVAAQKSPDNRQPKTKTNGKSAAKRADDQFQNLRQQQLLILQDNLVARTLSSVKNMDEVALRLSARNQILSYLWETRRSDNSSTPARSIALEAIADLASHHGEMSRFMFDYLSQDLAALVQKHQPDLREKLQAEIKSGKSENETGSIRSLLELTNGDVLAAAKIRQLLAQGGDVKDLNFLLDDLRTHNSKEFEPLLREVVDVALRGPQLSLDTLFWLSPIYFRPEVPSRLQKSYAVMVLARTHPTNFATGAVPQMAYDFLTGTLPYIQQLAPDLAEQAIGQSLVLRSSLNNTQLALEERRKRLKESQTPIEDLLEEAEAQKSNIQRNEMLAEAAEMALQEKKFSLCLHIVSKLEPIVGESGQIDFWGNWTSQFLKKFVKSAITAKQIEIAEKAALTMDASLAKVQAVILVTRYWSDAHDQGNAQRLFGEGAKSAEAISNYADKAKAFLLLSVTCPHVDESKKAPLLLSAIKALNSFNKPTDASADQTPLQEYVRNLDNTGYQLSRGFKELTSTDENAALALVDQLQKPDLRTFALIGILQGLNELLTKAQGAL